MKKTLFVLLFMFVCINVQAETVFDSNQNATEVKLTPAINTTSNQEVKSENIINANAVQKTSIRSQKFNSALTNLDDAQVELREELAAVTSKYNDAVVVKNDAVKKCKDLKSQIRALNSEMRSIEKSKKIINKNLEELQK